MTSQAGPRNGREAYRRDSSGSQGSFLSSLSTGPRPTYSQDPLTGDEPLNFDPSRPLPTSTRRLSTDAHSSSSDAVGPVRRRSRSSSMLAGVSQQRRRDSRDGGYRAGTPEGREQESVPGAAARGDPVRRRSEDAGLGYGPQVAARKGSTTSLRREVAEAASASTPRRDQVVEEKEETTQIGAVGGSTSRARSRTSSLTSASKPLHTPPTLLPAGVRTNPNEIHVPTRSSSFANLAHHASFTASSSSSLGPAYEQASRSSSPSSAYSSSSVSSEPGDEWATSHLPSGSSPPRSPLLAEIMAQPRLPSLAQAAAGVRKSRPESEFDVLAAYAHSDGGSLPTSPVPASPAIFVGPIAEESAHREVGVQSPPLPPLPPKTDEDQPERPSQSPPPPSERGDAFSSPINSYLSRPVLALTNPVPTIASSSSSPTSAITAIPSQLCSSASTIAHLSPTTPTYYGGLGEASGSRPPSRSSNRSPGPQPPRPPRRMQSNVSLMSAASVSVPEPAPNAPVAPSRATAPPSPHQALAAPPTPPSNPPSPPRTRPRAAATGPGSASELGVRSVAGSIKHRSPPPNIPEKSRRRTSALLSGHGRDSSVELNVLAENGTRAEETGKDKREDGEGKKGGQEEKEDGLFTPVSIAGSTFRQESGAGGGYLRDSFFASYASSPPISPQPPTLPPSPLPASSHFREPSSIDISPAGSPALSLPLPGHLRTGSGVSASTADGTAEDFHDARSTLSHASGPIDAAATANGLAVPSPVVEVPSPSSTAGSSREEVPAGGRERSITPSSQTKGDAKARAAAFIADLKRAKAEAVAGASNTPHQGLQAPQVEEDGFSDDDHEPGEDDTLVITAPTPAPPHASTPLPSVSPSVIVSPVHEESSKLPSVPSSPSAQPPHPSHRLQRSSSTARPPHSNAFPQPTKRPSQTSIVSTSPTLSRAYTHHIHSHSSTGSPTSATRPLGFHRSDTYSSFAAVPPPLHRRRPLPMAVQCIGELKAARSPRDRARIYATKINELRAEGSRLKEWIGAVRDLRSATGRASAPTSPATLRKLSRAARQDASTATFAPRHDGHAYKAREIGGSSTFGPKDLSPSNAPYPGVIGNKYPSSSVPASGSGGSGSKTSIFGFGSRSLGRRSSKRDPPSSSSSHFHPSSASSSTLSSIGIGSHSSPSTLHRAQIAASIPLQLNPSSSITPPSTVSSATGARLTAGGGGGGGLTGPRMPGQSVGSSTSPTPHRASFDSRLSSPSTSPILDRQATRASFSYGSTPPTTSKARLFSPARIGGEAVADPETEERLNRLGDILPQAIREDLRHALDKAGGDDVLAISVYLSDEAARRM